MRPDRLSPAAAAVLTFVAAACILIVEIAAGRLLAPYVGVSLTTYTGIIGAILAGIAVGAWAGGRAADVVPPEQLLGPTVILAGWATIASVPIVSAVGAIGLGDGILATVLLATTAFVLPAALLSAVAPMIVRATLQDLATSGSVVGRLSAIGTAGAITGTFLTGFVLLGLVPTRPLILGVGAILVVIGLVLTWRLGGDRRRAIALGGGSLVLGAVALLVPSPCDTESAYYCIDIREADDAAAGRFLILDGLTHAYVDLDDPTRLRFGYIRRFADVASVALGAAPAPVDALHIGGGGFSFPRYLAATRPDARQTVLELDPVVLGLARSQLGFAEDPTIAVRVGDARRSIVGEPTAGYDLVVGDAFGGLAVPWHLTTREFVAEIDRVLRPGGTVVMNLIDGPALRFVRAEAATLLERFDHVAVISGTPTLAGDTGGNVVLVASDEAIDGDAILASVRTWDEGGTTGIVVGDAEIDDFVGDARPLSDDFAPVDQLLGR
ncbi:MAG TPA: fused MFS/spermidine synthase [Candidatus Limnocylindrales bacterium]